MKRIIYIVTMLSVVLFAMSCGNSADQETRDMVDSLNVLSCKRLYVSARESESIANKALSLSEDYHDGNMEARCNVAHALMMQMEFDSAKVILEYVKSSTNNSLYILLADVEMMKLCQFVGANKEFYEYRSDAVIRIDRIIEDEDVMNDHQRLIWRIANCWYHLSLSSHYSNLRYEDEQAEAKIQYKKWFDELGSDSTIISEMFKKHDISHWKKYGNLYYESKELIRIADSLSLEGNNYEALDTLNRALQCVNEYYKLEDDDDKIHIFDMRDMDNVSKEMIWINDPEVITIPNWFASLREELSIVYGALGMKDASDYNHNIYFDILDATCIDLSLQERQERLEHEDKVQNVLFWTVVVISIVVIWLMIFVSKNISVRSAEKSERLSKLIDLCTVMTSALPTEATDSDDVANAIHEAADEQVKQLLPSVKGDWTKYNVKRIEKFDREMLTVLQVLYNWIMDNGRVVVEMTEESERVDSERYVHERRIEDNKRQYIDKETSVSIVNGITPFLDRALREVDRLKSVDVEKDRDEVNQRLEYIKELVEKIEAYNEVLGHWVKIRQGAVTLNVENFALQPLFDTLSKGRTMFDAKNITLDVPEASEAVVKADHALTLFMMNTLMDNARKYTPEGGVVKVSADITDDYVEISVKDSGNGLSPEDVDTLNNNKVYDSSKIGVNDDESGQIRKNKGFGFGLMNCRGIIEKYRKTNSLFDVCAFGVESNLGEGSRFYFRLPKGVIRTYLTIAFAVISTFAYADEHKDCEHTACEDINHCEELQLAEQYYDSVYSCNVRREYERAIAFADTAIMHLNHHHLLKNADPALMMQLDGETMNELILQKQGFETNYAVIIDIRNEVAIAALSLNRRHLYKYNNEIFTRLYKQISDDRTLEDYCNSIQESTINKQVTSTLILCLVFVLLLVYALLYYRHNLLYIFNMRQLLRFVHKLFSAKQEELKSTLFQGVNEIRVVETIGVASLDVNSLEEQLVYSFEGNTECRVMLEQFMNLCYKREEHLSNERERFLAYPLIVNVEGDRKCIGAIGMMLHDAHISKNDELTLQLIANFYAMHSYFCSTRVDEQKAELELRQDIMRRTKHEDNQMHIQNMVLDNYLSTIKHETMYYPGRIKQIAESAIKEPDASRLKDLAEITTYYKEVFSLLCNGASGQLQRRVFKREKLNVSDLSKYARRAFDKQNRKLQLPLTLEIEESEPGLVLQTDRIIANYMIDTLLSGSFQDESMGVLKLYFAKSEKFTMFAYSDSRLEYNDEEMKNLFYADNIKYDSITGMLHGSQFLLLKQMVREHDEYSGNKGCRIYAEHAEEGTRIVMML